MCGKTSVTPKLFTYSCNILTRILKRPRVQVRTDVCASAAIDISGTDVSAALWQQFVKIPLCFDKVHKEDNAFTRNWSNNASQVLLPNINAQPI